MVSQDDVAARQPGEKFAETRLPASPRNEISADQRQIRLPLFHPRNRTLNRPRAAGRNAEVEVGEMRDAQPLELRRQPPHRNLLGLQPNPARLEPGVSGESRAEA